MCRVLALAASLLFVSPVVGQDADWYSEGDVAPTKRLKIQLVNTLSIDRKDCPVIIARYKDLKHGFYHREGFYDTLLETDRFLKSLGYLEGPPTLEKRTEVKPESK